MTVRRRLVPLLLLIALALPAEARDERPTTPTEPFERALAKLESPLARHREEGVTELVRLLPGARKRVLEAVAKAPWEVRAGLLQVLAQDGADASINALLDVLTEADDAQAAAVFLRVVADPITSSQLLARLRADRKRFVGSGKMRVRRFEQLAALLLRAEIEDKFVGRKSRTGTTGYYRGQYDVLKYARAKALEVVAHIAMDKAIHVPGVYRTGPYRFLRPKPIDFWEIRDMATNAIGELATPADERMLLELEAYTLKLRREVEEENDRLSMIQGTVDLAEFQEMQEDFGIKVGRYGDLLTAMHIAKRDQDSKFAIRKYIYVVETRWVHNLRFGLFTARSIKATTLIRAGWYEEAVRQYERLLTDPFASKSTAYYNIACAYASWSLDPELEPAQKGMMRSQALMNLEQAVNVGWTDLGWMDEDGDLDPIRTSPRYKALVDRIRRELGIK